MKKSHSILIAAAMLLASCSQDEHSEGMTTGMTVPMTFTAGQVQTRTQLAENNAVHWTENDAIAIWDEKMIRKFTASEVNESNATFTGEASEAITYTAFYPYTDDWTLSFGNGTITFTLPTSQNAVEGSFANRLAPSWAQTTDNSRHLQFHNLCALVKFAVDNAGLESAASVTLASNGDEKLAGSMTFTIDTNGGTLTAASNATSQVTLSGNFEPGKTYYFVAAPGTLEDGFSIIYKGSDGKFYKRSTSKSVTLTAGKILNVGTLVADEFSEAITNKAFINAVEKNVPNIGWTKEPDGTVLMTYANRMAIEKVTSLSLASESLDDLTGIEYFTKLTNLNCYSNKLTSLDVSKLTNLESLDCMNNSIKLLNINGLTKLISLSCSYNPLGSLDVRDHTKLTTLICCRNGLVSLDVSTLTGLTTLHCDENKLTSLDVSMLTKLKSLSCVDNELTELDVSNLTYLNNLSCHENQLTKLDLSGLTGMTVLYCLNNKLTELDVSELTNLTHLYCQKNLLTELDVSKLTKLNWLGCNDNQLTELDVSYLSELKYLDCNENQLTELDITNLPKLSYLYCGNQVQPMTLILTTSQQTIWDDKWVKDSSNQGVNLQVKSSD